MQMESTRGGRRSWTPGSERPTFGVTLSSAFLWISPNRILEAGIEGSGAKLPTSTGRLKS